MKNINKNIRVPNFKHYTGRIRTVSGKIRGYLLSGTPHPMFTIENEYVFYNEQGELFSFQYDEKTVGEEPTYYIDGEPFFYLITQFESFVDRVDPLTGKWIEENSTEGGNEKSTD